MSNEKILVIDDEKNIRNNLTKCLTDYDVETAVNGEEGLKKFRDEEYDLVLLDMKLPGISGIDVLAKIKEVDPGAIVVMITGYGSVETAVKTMKLGAVDYLSKPFTCDEILEAVKSVLKRKQAEMSEDELSTYDEFVDFAKNCIVDRQFSKALKYLQKAVSLDTSNPEAFNLMGILLEMENEVLEAQKKYRAALALDPTYKPAQENLDRTTQRDYSKEGMNFGGDKSDKKDS